jgi:hypothetical protein
MDTKNLTSKEQRYLKNWVVQMEAGEIAQAQDLIDNCNITFQFAKTHSVYIKDRGKTKQQMEDNLSRSIFPHGVSADLFRTIIDASDEGVKKK